MIHFWVKWTGSAKYFNIRRPGISCPLHGKKTWESQKYGNHCTSTNPIGGRISTYRDSWGFCKNPSRDRWSADEQWAPLSESTRVRGSRACSKLIRHETPIEDSCFCWTTYQSPNSVYKIYGFKRRSAIPHLSRFSSPYHATSCLLRFEL